MHDIEDFEFMDRDKKPKRKRGKIFFAIVIAIIIVLACIAYVVFVQDDIGKFGTDYWFEMGEDNEEILKTADGWTFELNVVQNYTLEGIILGTKLYYKHDSPYRPINTFSPVDIFVGVDDVVDNVSKYDYEIRSFKDREIKWYMYYDDIADYEYFKTHTGNNHLIPHNDMAYSKMLELEKNDKFSLGGYIVQPYGTNGEEWYSWPSDTEIGNYACEVILVDYIVLK